MDLPGDTHFLSGETRDAEGEDRSCVQCKFVFQHISYSKLNLNCNDMLVIIVKESKRRSHKDFNLSRVGHSKPGTLCYTFSIVFQETIEVLR